MMKRHTFPISLLITTAVLLLVCNVQQQTLAQTQQRQHPRDRMLQTRPFRPQRQPLYRSMFNAHMKRKVPDESPSVSANEPSPTKEQAPSPTNGENTMTTVAPTLSPTTTTTKDTAPIVSSPTATTTTTTGLNLTPSPSSSSFSSPMTTTTTDLTTDSLQPTAVTTTEVSITPTTAATTTIVEPITTATTTTEEPITTTTLESITTSTTLEPVPTITAITTTAVSTTTSTEPIIATASTTVAPPVITTQNPTTTQTKSSKPSTTDHPSKHPVDHSTKTASNADAQPSDKTSSTSSGSSSISNKTGITIGVVIGAVVIAIGIGVWVFRKWKLSPSRQFKSKIRGSTSGSLGGAGVANREDKTPDYDAYDNFHPTAHDNGRPVAASPMAGAASGSGSRTSPQMQYRQQQEEHDQLPQGQQPPMSEPQHPHHMNMESSATVPNYSQYRYVQAGQGPIMTGINGYDTGVPETMLGTNNNGIYYHQQQHPMYAPQGYGTYNDHFLRELRE